MFLAHLRFTRTSSVRSGLEFVPKCFKDGPFSARLLDPILPCVLTMKSKPLIKVASGFLKVDQAEVTRGKTAKAVTLA